MSQARLAGLSGVDPSTISRIELGKISPELDTLNKLAKGLDIDPVVLLGVDRDAADGGGDEAWRGAVRAYLASPFGSDTPPKVAERLQSVPYKQLWLQSDRVADVHCLREMLERQWRKLPPGAAAAEGAPTAGGTKQAQSRRKKSRKKRGTHD